MQWMDDGLVLATRLHGESSAVVELMTRHHGRHLGLMRGAKSQKNRPLLQAGNLVAASWHARLDEHLGQWTLDLTAAQAGRLMHNRLSLATLNHMVDLLRLLPEREPHPALFEAALLISATDHAAATLGALVVKFELRLLEDLGFGLDLSECAATGTCDNLIYVSPKSGRAVSAEAGAPWKDRLFALPPFCRGAAGATAGDIGAGLALSGHFLSRHLLEPRRLEQSCHRATFVAYMDQHLQNGP